MTASASLEKPLTDTREYKVITLPNGMSCALISDSQ